MRRQTIVKTTHSVKTNDQVKFVRFVFFLINLVSNFRRNRLKALSKERINPRTRPRLRPRPLDAVFKTKSIAPINTYYNYISFFDCQWKRHPGARGKSKASNYLSHYFNLSCQNGGHKKMVYIVDMIRALMWLSPPHAWYSKEPCTSGKNA